jgi:hypothetical protein
MYMSNYFSLGDENKAGFIYNMKKNNQHSKGFRDFLF